MDPERYFVDLACAFVRGHRPDLAAAHDDPSSLLAQAKAEGLSLHKFKRSATLPRVKRVLGILRGLLPAELLDIGSGRGVFLWPLLDAFPGLQVTSLELDEIRVRDIEAVRRGGIERVRAVQDDVCGPSMPDDAVDVATALEVLEHLEQPQEAAAALLRVARRFVVVSVPSGPDDNPQHIQLFSSDRMRSMFLDAGARRVQIEYVPGHMIAVIRVAGSGR